MRNRRARDLAALQDPSLAPLQAALTAEPAAEELSGEREALVTYRAVSWDRSRRWHRPAILATKVGVATLAGVLGLSGVATAAYTGSLPNALQDVAHKTIKAPPAHAKGPDASGPAAHGLCQAFAKDKDDEAKEQRKAAERSAEKAAERSAEKAAERSAEKAAEKAAERSAEKAAERSAEKAAERDAEGASPKATPPGVAKKAEKSQGNGKSQEAGEHGRSKEGSVAYRNLVRAAGGENKVDAYCAKVLADKAEAKASESPKPEKSAQATKSPKPASSAKPAPPARATARATPSTTSEPTPTATPTADPTSSPTG